MQDAELGHREPHGLVVQRGSETEGIQGERSHVQDVVRGRAGGALASLCALPGVLPSVLPGVRAPRPRAPEQDLHAGGQLAQGERLAQVVIGAELQAEHPVELFVAGGEEHDRHRVRRCAQAPAQLQPVHAGHDDVQDGEVRHREENESQASTPSEKTAVR